MGRFLRHETLVNGITLRLPASLARPPPVEETPIRPEHTRGRSEVPAIVAPATTSVQHLILLHKGRDYESTYNWYANLEVGAEVMTN